MKSVLKYLSDYKKEVVLAPLFKMLEAIFELFVPLVVASIIDEGIAGGDKEYIIKMCLIMVGLGVVGLISAISAQFFAAKAAVGFARKLRYALFVKTQKLSFSQLDTLGTSNVITRMTSDVNQVQTGVNMVLRLFLRSPFIVFGAMIMAFTVDVKAAMIFVVTIPVLSVIVYGIMLITMPMYKKVQSSLDGVMKITRENLSGIRVLRAFCKESSEIERFDNTNSELSNRQKLVGRISGLLNPLTFVVINMAIIILIHTGAMRVDMGIISQGAVVALYNYMSQILVELIKLANLIVTITKAVASGKRLEELLNIEEVEGDLSINADENVSDDLSDDTDTMQMAVSFENVSLTYDNAGETSLKDITFDVKKGEKIGIIGGTGSGKTSLVHLIPRFYDASEGAVRIYGRDVKECDRKKLRNKIAIVMQKSVLFKGTIRENLLWGNENATDDELNKALDIACARDVVDSKGGLDAMILQGGSNLSGGQKQRLAIARALVKRPEILIMDDSASALDYATDAKLRNAINSLDYKPTVFIVSQRTASVMHADKIIVLEEGKMCAIGTHSELMKECSVYKEIYESQFKGSREAEGNE